MDLHTALSLPNIPSTPLPAPDTLPTRAAHEQAPAILVIDDEPSVGVIMRRLLQDQVPQYDIIVATHPSEALERIRGRTVVLKITDFNMPDMDGICLAAAI
jgi:CheY-like chemotaxis protein